MKRIFTLTTILAAGALAGFHAEARLTLAEAQARGLKADSRVKSGPVRNALPTITGEASTMRVSDPARKNTPHRLSEKGSAIYGYMGYADRYRFVPAMCELDGHAFNPIWNDPRYVSDDAIMTTGWLVGDKVCGFATFSFMGMTFATYSVECDLASGRTIEFAELPEGTPVFAIATLAKDDNTLYGIRAKGGKYFFAKAPADAPTKITEIMEAPQELHLISMTYRDDDRTIYGVNTDGELLKVGRDGTWTLLKLLETPKEVAAYNTGLIYVPADREFIWNVNYTDYTASTFAIDAETYGLTLIDECPENEQYMFFVSPDGAYEPTAPCRPQLGEISFPNGALSGTVSFKLPEELQDGTKISGEMTYEITFDNATYTEGKGQPGAMVTADFKNLEQGFHTFGIRVTAGGKTGPLQLVSAYLGQDTPLPPTGVKLTETELSWNAVTEGVNGGYVDAENMIYHIFFEEDEVGATSDTRFTPDLPTDRPVSAMSMNVVAEYDNIWSEPAWSNSIVLGKPLEMPVTIKPTRDQVMICTGVDANDSGNGWNYDSGQGTFSMIMNDKDADAWIFMPLIEFEKTDRFYTLAFEARSLRSTVEGEQLGIYIGKEDKPEAMKLLGETFTPSLSGFESYERLVKVDEPGAYVIGLRYTSPAGKYGVGVKNLTLVDGGVTPDSPARPTGITATAAAQGELKARIDFTFPTTDVMGNPLPADTKLKAVVEGAGKAVANGKPGDKAYASVATVQGDNRISVTVSIDGKNSPVGYVNVYTGVVKPVGVGQMGYMPLENMMGVTMAWSEVTKGVNGGYVDPKDITYTVLRYEETGYTSTWKPVAEGLTDTMYTFEFEPGTPQCLLRLGVCAVNAAGRSEEMAVVALVAGTPYTLPMEDDFAKADDEGAKYAPYINYRMNQDYTLTFIFVTPDELGSEFADEEGFYFVATGEDGAKGRLGLPCFTTENTGAEFTLTALCGNGFCPLSVWVDCLSFDAPQYIGTMPEEGGLVTKTFRLPEGTENKGWVQVFVDGTITDSGILAMRGFSVTPVEKVERTLSGEIHVKGGDGLVEVSGAEGERIEVFAVSGVRAAVREKSSSREAVALPAGVYLVKTAGRVFKTVVR